MAFADKKGINLASPFKLQAEELLDVRQQVNSITERNELVTLHAATAGLRVYVKADKCSYVYNGSGWDKLATSVYSHPTGDGNLHVPATGTSHNNQVLTAGSTAGSIAWKTITASMISDLPKYSLGSFGITASATELNYMKGVTSAVQTQLDDKAPKDHTHSSINDSDNNDEITFSYSKPKLPYKDYTYIAAWNGYELRAISKEQFAAANHTHPYIPIAGAIIEGQIYKGESGNWIADRDNVAVEGISIDTGHYNCVVGQATQQGHWSIGNFAGNENLYFNYTTNADYEAKKNISQAVQLPNKAGTIITSATIGSQSVDHANTADSATTASKLGTNAGSATQPVYFTGGVPKACTYTLGKSVPADAVFTDHTYTLSSFNITASATELNYMKGVTSAVQTQLDGKAPKDHTHNYAGSSSAGGAATSALSVVDYGNTANTLSIGFAGDGLSSSTFKYFAGYDGNGHIKNGSIDVVKSVLGLSSYLPLSGGTITGPLKFTSLNAFDDKPTYILGIESLDNGGELKYKLASDISVGSAKNALTAQSANLAERANSASALTTDAGSATQPIYITDGIPTACTYTLGKSVPSSAVFTDTWTPMKGATSSAAGTAGYVPAPAAGASNRYLRSDGTWSVPPDTNTTYTLGSFGITASAAELNYMKGVTSAVQTQLNAKASSSHSHSAATTSAAGFMPKLSGSSSQVLRGDGTWGSVSGGDTKVTNTLVTTTQAYITGTTSSSTNTGTQVFDTGVYLTDTPGEIHADSSVEIGGASLQWDSANKRIAIVFS